MKKLQPRRLTLKGWAAIDTLRRKIESEAQRGNLMSLPPFVREIIELGTGKKPNNKFWLDDAQLYLETLAVNNPTKPFPILTTKEKGKEMPWEYEGRTLYFWVHLFASEYGWTQEYVWDMDVDDVIALYQEVVIDRQMEQEWQASLSEMSYTYDKTTKKSRLISLPRPDWMRAVTPKSPTPVKTSKMPVIAMPMGVVVTLDEKPNLPSQPADAIE